MTLANPLNEHARDWLHARAVIAAALAELVPDMTVAWYEHNAAAIIARLATGESPLLLARPEELKS
jgi:hypothetical protein